MAKDESRKIHLFCKGLEHIREIFYTEPEVSESLSYIMDVVLTHFCRIRAQFLLLSCKTCFPLARRVLS